MPYLQDYRAPEWSAKVLRRVAEDTLSKTRVFNAAADTWRLGRPEDLRNSSNVSLAEGTYCWTVPPGVQTVIGPFNIPPGQGWTFFGLWLATDLGCGSYIFLKVNGVKRQDVPGRLAYKVRGYDCCQKLMLLEQLVFVRENDKVEIIMNNTTGSTLDVDYFPDFIVAGERKSLLVAD